MSAIQRLVTEHIDIWTAADTGKRSGRGRASSSAGSVYGVKKLRELILELAVRGKLVPQNANDEPASELLKRIQAEKAKLVAEGKIKKEKQLIPITDDEKPFKLPHGWMWVRLGALGDWGAGATPLRSISSYYGGDTPWFKSGELSADFIDNSEESITELALKECSLRLNQPGDVLIAMYGATIGKAAILNVVGTTNQAVCACTPNAGIFNRYLLTMLKAMKSNFIGQGAGGAQPNISREKIIATISAIPPITEQHRIVAKVDELMALCDLLEAQHSNAAEAHEKLVSHLLGTLTQSQSADDFSINWQRIAAHFDTLFTTEASIDALKQTLLQLAVMGKLVPQDANDEPASALLKRIQAEKAKLIAEGKLKKEKPLAPIGEDEKLFELPKGWEWVRLSTISTMKGGFAFPSSSFSEKGEYQVLKMGNVKPGQIRLKDKPAFVGEVTAKLAIEAKLDMNDIVITMTGTVGKRDYVYSAMVTDIDIIEGALFINQRLCAVKPYIAASVFLDKAMKNDRLMDEIFASATGTANQANISMAALANWLLPLPPLEEQHRIVAKVDALIALCDQLKTRIQQANQQQQTIADALVAQAVA